MITKEKYAENELSRLKRSRNEYKVEISIITLIILVAVGVMLYIDMSWIGNTIFSVGSGLCVIIGVFLIYFDKEYKIKINILEEMVKESGIRWKIK